MSSCRAAEQLRASRVHRRGGGARTVLWCALRVLSLSVCFCSGCATSSASTNSASPKKSCGRSRGRDAHRVRARPTTRRQAGLEGRWQSRAGAHAFPRVDGGGVLPLVNVHDDHAEALDLFKVVRHLRAHANGWSGPSGRPCCSLSPGAAALVDCSGLQSPRHDPPESRRWALPLTRKGTVKVGSAGEAAQAWHHML